MGSLMDPLFRVALISATPDPQRTCWAAMHTDYAEDFVAADPSSWPEETAAGTALVKHLLAGERGHYGPLEHAQIVLNVGWFPHSVMQQARTHRVGCCLAGDTVVPFGHPSLSDGEIYYSKTIQELADLWDRGRSHQPGDADAAYMQRMISQRNLMQVNEDTGHVQATRITNIYRNGEKAVHEYTFDNGLTITATKDHKVFTPSGWKQFSQVAVGDCVMAACAMGRHVHPCLPDIIEEDEHWKAVDGFCWYEVSDMGRIRSWAPRKHRGVLVTPSRPRLKKPSVGSKNGYLYVSLSKPDGGGSARINVHSLVLSAFRGSRPDGLVARHINGNRWDNRLSNLQWGTEFENAQDRALHGVTRKNRAVPIKLARVEAKGVIPTYDLEVEGPFHNFIANGIVVHNSFDVQSGRYTGQRICKVATGELQPEEVFYLRPVGEYRDRQGKRYVYKDFERAFDLEDCLAAARRYRAKISEGFAEEHARGLIPFDIRQHFVVSFSLRALMHFLDLRAKADAQLEIQQLCELMLPHFEAWAPEIAAWYVKHRWGKARLAP